MVKGFFRSRLGSRMKETMEEVGAEAKLSRSLETPEMEVEEHLRCHLGGSPGEGLG